MIKRIYSNSQLELVGGLPGNEYDHRKPLSFQDVVPGDAVGLKYETGIIEGPYEVVDHGEEGHLFWIEFDEFDLDDPPDEELTCGTASQRRTAMSAPKYRGVKTTEAEVFTRKEVQLLFPGTDPRRAVVLLIDRDKSLNRKPVEARTIVDHEGRVGAIVMVRQVVLPELDEEA